jgi:DNA primase
MLIDDIKGQINIIDLAKQAGLDLKKQSNRLYKAKCIFHNDTKTPNLFFYSETNTFKCYACGKWGDAINFYAELKGISNGEALKELADNYGLLTGIYKDIIITTDKEERDKPEPFNPIKYTPIYEALLEFCGEPTDETIKYLTGDKRGLTIDTIKHFKIFDIKDYKKTKEFLTNKFDLDILKTIGLIDSKNRFVFTKNKIILPLIADNKIISLRARFFDNGIAEPKQITTTFSYSKYKSLQGIGGQLFNEDILKTIKADEKVYLCEGEFDTMIAEQNGLKAIGLLGASNFNTETIKRLKDFDLIICFDNDKAGKEQSYKIADEFKKITKRDAKINILPKEAKDLTEFFIKKQNEKL